MGFNLGFKELINIKFSRQIIKNIVIIIIINNNIKDWTLWSVPSPELQLLSPTFLGLPIVLLPCGLQWYDFKGIQFGGILYKCKSQFRLYSSILSSI
jgi:hypothetical protein